jgi:23S rRNA pseudouridine2605 synthase
MRHAAQMQKKPYASERKLPRHGVARILSKFGVGSRTQAAAWVREGRVRVNGRVVRDPEFPVSLEADKVLVDGRPLRAVERVYLMLNKPRGLLTTTADEHGRDNVYSCFAGSDLPWIAPVGRLDKASEGLLLFSNDPEWAARITDPETGPDKTYRVQVDALVDETMLRRIEQGIVDGSEHLGAKSVSLLRVGEKNCWLEIVLDEGRNRQIRRLLAAFDLSVLRLIRVAIGGLVLGELPKGQWRALSEEEVAALSPSL